MDFHVISIASFKRIINDARENGCNDDVSLAEFLAGYLYGDLTSDTKKEWLMDYEDRVLDPFLTPLNPTPEGWTVTAVDLNPEDY